MKLKWSGFGATDGRGKINGHVASKNRAGAYARTKVTPVNPQTSFQIAVRARLSTFSTGWRALTQAVRDQWDAAVGGFAKTDVFGDLRNPTGKNLYTRLNQNLVSVGEPAITTPPLPTGVETVTVGAVVMAEGGAKSIVHGIGTGAANVQLWATPPVSPGKSFLKNDYRLVTTFANDAASPHVFTTAYDARFGDTITGAKVGVKLVAVNVLTGETALLGETQVLST